MLARHTHNLCDMPAHKLNHHHMNYTRNEFLKLTGLGAAGIMAATTGSSFAKNPVASDYKFTLGLASYTTRNFSLDDTIKWMLRLGLTSVSLKDKHMPLE